MKSRIELVYRELILAYMEAFNKEDYVKAEEIMKQIKDYNEEHAD